MRGINIVENLLSFTFYNWLIETGDLGVGPGLWCPLHIILMVLLFSWMIICWFIFRKYKNFGLKFTKVVCWIMLVSRLARMALLIITGKETFIQAMPWHLCHIMAIVFPIMFLTKTKKFFLPIVCVTLFGGVLTFVFGDYYKFSTLSFLQYESLLLHFCMPTAVIGVVATGYFKIKLEEFWQIFVFLIMLMCHAELGNTLVPGSNFLFLRENGLPFNLFGDAHFFFTYIVLVLIIGILFTAPIIIALIQKKKKQKKIRERVREKVVLNTKDVIQ